VGLVRLASILNGASAEHCLSNDLGIKSGCDGECQRTTLAVGPTTASPIFWQAMTFVIKRHVVPGDARSPPISSGALLARSAPQFQTPFNEQATLFRQTDLFAQNL
jgi:hypothetical protein